MFACGYKLRLAMFQYDVTRLEFGIIRNSICENVELYLASISKLQKEPNSENVMAL